MHYKGLEIDDDDMEEAVKKVIEEFGVPPALREISTVDAFKDAFKTEEDPDMKLEKEMRDELINEILGMAETPKVVEPVVEEEVLSAPEPRPAIVGFEELLPDGNTCYHRPFEDVFGWKPELDHLVQTYTDYPCEAPMEGYVVDRKMVETVSLCESVGLKQNMTGPTGCGKTLLAEWYAAMTGRPYLRIAHTEAFDRTEVFGQTHITGGDTDFRMGVLPKTFDMPYLVLLDELTRAPAFALMVYGTMLDRRHLLLPEMKDGGMAPLEPVEGWSVWAADNTKGNGDGMDKYIASNVQDSAFLNRFDVVHENDYLSEENEALMIAGIMPDLGTVQQKRLATLSSLLHTGAKEGKLTTEFSPRNLQAMGKLVNAGMTLRQAFTINYYNRVTECEVQDIAETYRSVFGEQLD